MKKYKCQICGQIIEIEDISALDKCLICGAGVEFLEEVESSDSLEVKDIEGPIPISSENPAIERIEDKCIKCGLCSKVCQQKVGVKYNPLKTDNPVCINCGQCIINCPVGAISPKYCYKKVMDYIHDTEKIVICYTAPAVRVALGEEFGIPGNVEGKMVNALRKIGFNYVFDVSFGADLTIMEEATELIEKIKSNEKLPQFTSCCPSWVKYVEMYHPELINNLSTCKSPIGMQGSIIKNYFSEMMLIPKDKIITVAITPCTAKKAEIKRDKFNDTDFVITTSEAAMLIREEEIDFCSLGDSDYDKIMERGSGSGIIFGSSGGVMEAALRTSYKFITGDNPPDRLLNLSEVRGYDNVKSSTIEIGDIKLKVLVVFGMTNIEKIISSGEYKNYDFIEVMNCPGGCVGGGGQPLGVISRQKQTIEARSKSLYDEDKDLKIRNCYDNPDIIDLYKSYLHHPMSDEAIKLLHTSYKDKSSILGE